MADNRYLLALATIDGMHSKERLLLLDYFGSAEEAWKKFHSWHEVINMSPRVREKLAVNYRTFSVDEYYESFLKTGAGLLCYVDEDFSESLRNIDNPPFLLYYFGRKELLFEKSIAVVGTRKPTNYGCEASFIFSRDLARAGFCVASGMARGLDSRAHLGALAAGGNTIAVLGSGIDVIYPPENVKLFRDVAEKGLIITEYPLGTPAHKSNFPYRNRLISALADALVVVEAGEQSGTQITVNYAIDQGKEVFALPGPIFSPQSMGTHLMIRKGAAKMVTSVEELMEDLDFSCQFNFGTTVRKASVNEGVTASESYDLQYIRSLMTTPIHINELARKTKMGLGELNEYLLRWQLQGLVKDIGGDYFVVNEEWL